MNCSAHIVKYIVFVFNIVFVVGGVLVIIVGSIMLNNLSDSKSIEAAEHNQKLSILIIILGCIVFVIAFFGCCGAIREIFFCVTIYTVLMFIIFCLQVALVIWIFVHHKSILSTVEKVIDEAFTRNDEASGYPMDALQIAFHCCGSKSYEDYTNKEQKVPASCCGNRNKIDTCLKDIYTAKPGCKWKYIRFWSKIYYIICVGGIILALVELVTFAFACCLALSIRAT